LEAAVQTAIHNPRTGQRMEFVSEGRELLEIDTVNPPTGIREPEHVHPKQTSGARVTAGSLVFEVGGVEGRVHAGESIEIPANTPHRFWNDADEDAHAVQWFRPALNTRSFFETLFALAQAGELDERGMPGLLQIAVMIPEFSDVIRPTRPPWQVQRAVAALLGPIARRRGHSANRGGRPGGR
jgi:quercetin dioxygenase-like cupin family protein